MINCDIDKRQYMFNCGGKNTLDFFKAMCDSNRHRILLLIKQKGEVNASYIIEKMNLSQPTISHHLKIMVESGVLKVHREGKEAYYKINEDLISSCCRGFAENFCSPKGRK
jgi:ArsR family transcriptional regulator